MPTVAFRRGAALALSSQQEGSLFFASPWQQACVSCQGVAEKIPLDIFEALIEGKVVRALLYGSQNTKYT